MLINDNMTQNGYIKRFNTIIFALFMLKFWIIIKQKR